jgi:hypothetical protein
MNTTLAIALIFTASLAEAQTTSASAQATADKAQMDSRFNSWLGCWRLEDDLAGTGARMCITPDRTGVRLQTIVGTTRGIDELVIADGTVRPIQDAECTGTEASEWSQDGLRVFRSTQVTCKNETPRTIKAIAFLAPGPVWTLVQHVTGPAPTASVRVQRYRRAFNQNLADGSKAPQPGGAAGAMLTARDAAWSIEDVIEASGKLPSEALEAALGDVRYGFNLNKHTLVQLDDADVPPSVIDLMVALTFPKRFVVERAGGGGAPVGVTTGMGWYDPFMSPMWYGAYGNCYMNDFSRYYGYRSYYNTCGYYSGYGPYYNGGYYYPGGGWVIVDNGGGTGVPDTGTGRAVNGRGYTQIRERSPEPSVSRGNNGGNGSASGWSGNNGGGVSSGGYSSGSSGSSGGGSSSGGDGGRTAVARPPGGSH